MLGYGQAWSYYAALHGSVGGDSQLASVKDALRALEAAHQVRRGDG